MTAEDRQPRAGLLLALCLLLVACVYARVLEGPFLWDDRHLVDSDNMRQGTVVQLFRQPFWLAPPGHSGSQAYYRPLTSSSFLLDYRLHDGNPSGFHLTNLALHLVATGLVFGLLRRRGCGAPFAFLMTCLWSLLPRLTEGAAWISGRGDVLVTVFALAAYSVYRPGAIARLAAASILGAAALLSKESGIAVLLLLGVLELSGPMRARAGLFTRLALLATPLVGYLVLRVSAGATSIGDGAVRSTAARALTSLEALGRYGLMLFDPLQPRSLIGQPNRVAWAYVTLGLVVLLGLIAGLRHVRRLTTETRALGVLALAPIAMVLHLTPLPLTVVAADRYLYLPSAALFLAIAPVLQRWCANKPARSALLLAMVVACGGRTFQRAGDYADDAGFWMEAVKSAPDASTGWIELGAVAYRAGLFREGLRLSEGALSIDLPESGQALDNAALMAMAAGERELAARLGDELVKSFPHHAAYRLRRAAIALNARDLVRAEQEARRALALSPSYERAQLLLSVVARTRQGMAQEPVPLGLVQGLDIDALRYPEAAARLQEMLRAPRPELPTIRAGLEQLVVRDEPERARRLFQTYLDRFGADGTQAWELALTSRLERARAVRERLAALDNGD